MNPLRALADDHFRLYHDAERGTWRAAFYDLSGRRRWLRLPARTEDEARAQARRLERAANQQPALRDGRGIPTLTEWRARWLDLSHERAPRTIKAALQSIDRFIGFAGDARLDRVTPELAAEWVASLAKPPRGRPAPALATVRTHARAVKAWLQGAVNLDLIAANPFRRIRTTQPALDTEWPWIGDLEMARLLAACPTDDYRRLLGLARWGGLRRNECLRVTWADLRTAGDGSTWLSVPNPGRVRTTKRRARDVRVDARLAPLLAGVGVGLIVGRPGGAQTIGKTIRAIFEAAGYVPISDPLQTMRRCCGCDWAQRQGIDAFTTAAMLGHSPAVHQAWYRRTIDLLPRLACAPGVPKAVRPVPVPVTRRRVKNPVSQAGNGV